MPFVTRTLSGSVSRNLIIHIEATVVVIEPTSAIGIGIKGLVRSSAWAVFVLGDHLIGSYCSTWMVLAALVSPGNGPRTEVLAFHESSAIFLQPLAIESFV